jgi:O-antigen/teichoic acid export membrane protein
LSGSRAAAGRAVGQPDGGRSYGRGARVLSVGIASTGALTFAYFAIASHILGEVSAKRIDLLWSIMFVTISVIYRPIEQLLSRTIAERRALGHLEHSLRVPIAIQIGFALAFLVVALTLRNTLTDHVFNHSDGLYIVLVTGTVAYAASYFARGWLAGHERFALYGGLVFLESTSRFLFALAAAIGISSGQSAIALGMAVAPFVSLSVVPFALVRLRRDAHVPTAAERDAPALDAAGEGPAHAGIEEAAADLSMQRGARFATAVFGIMLAEQTLMNAAVLIVNAHSGRALAGFVFNVLMIVRAPLQLFQAIQTSILPHLTALAARGDGREFGRAVRKTVLLVGGFAGAAAIGLLAIGPFAMDVLFSDKGFSYQRVGLAIVAVGMGFHLVSGTLNQAALARQRAGLAAAAWLLSGALFVIWVAVPTISDQVLRVETGYCGATLVLCGLLYGLYRRSAPASDYS